MNIRKAKINNKLYDVITLDEYNKHPDLYLSDSTAIEDDGILYPLKNSMDKNIPGMYHTQAINFFIKPENENEYSSDNIIDFSGDSIKDIIESHNKLKNAERTILTTIDNLFLPVIDKDDDPEMKALKEAIICKNIDIDKYADRFGKNFPNDKRILKKESITMSKLKSVMNALDMKGTLIIEDKNSEVPNPIGKRIITEITIGEDEETDETK